MTFTERHGEQLEDFARIVGIDKAAHIAGHTNQAEEDWETLIGMFIDRESHTPLDVVRYVVEMGEQRLGSSLMVAAAIEAERRMKEAHDG